mmetsp:Transcript_5227/g.8053  ORF Transcript_5227/g.8053 Transcript_5227/m.8053 type:complete len:93 (-) Transcript_5227:1159-1437(-)
MDQTSAAVPLHTVKVGVYPPRDEQEVRMAETYTDGLKPLQNVLLFRRRSVPDAFVGGDVTCGVDTELEGVVGADIVRGSPVEVREDTGDNCC